MLRALSGDTVEMVQYDSLDKYKDTVLDGKFEHVFMIYDEDLKNASGRKDIASVLSSRILPLKKPSDLTKGIAFAREVEVAAVILGTTDLEEIDGGIGNALTLHSVMIQLVGPDVEMSDLKLLMGLKEGDLGQISSRIGALITRLLISKPISSYDMDQKINSRRQLLWSA